MSGVRTRAAPSFRWSIALLFCCAWGATSSQKPATHNNAHGGANAARRPVRRTAVLFRTHLLDPTTLVLLRRLLEDVRRSCHVALIYDADLLTEPAVRSFVAQALSGGNWTTRDGGGSGGVELFGVSVSDYVSGFQGRGTRPFEGEASSSPYKVKHNHPEVAYVLWARAHRGAFRFVYGVEYDVAFSGNFSDFVRAHESDPRDLLAIQVSRARRIVMCAGKRYALGGSGSPQVGWRDADNWFYTHMSTDAKRYVGDATAALYGPILRYSDRLLALLGRLYGSNHIGYCEVQRI